jgi:hypothetical protein
MVPARAAYGDVTDAVSHRMRKIPDTNFWELHPTLIYNPHGNTENSVWVFDPCGYDTDCSFSGKNLKRKRFSLRLGK